MNDNNLFILTSNLARINNENTLVELYVKSLTDFFEGVIFNWSNVKCNDYSLLLSDEGKEYGYICYNKKLSNDNYTLLSNSVQMLTVFLNRIKQHQFLEANKKELENLVDIRTRELLLSEEKYQLLFDNAGMSISLCTVDGTIISYNETAAKSMGGKPADFIGKNLVELFPSVPNKLYVERFNDVVKSNLPLTYVDRVVVPNGIKWFRSICTKVVINSELIVVQSISEDITEQKETEKKIENEIQFSNSLINSLFDTFYLFDPFDGKSIRWNRAFLDVSGYTDAEIAKMKTPDDFYSKEDIEKTGELIKTVLENGVGVIELSLVCKDGHKVPTEYMVSAIKDEDDKVKYLISIGRDISHKVLAEKRINHSIDRLNLSLEAINASVYEDHLLTGKTIFTTELFKSLGYSESEIPTDIEMFTKLVHPEDLQLIQESLNHYFNGFAPYYYCQYRLKSKSNDWNWISSQGKIFSKDKDGNPKVLVGIIQDINFNKVAEIAIMEQNDEIAHQNEEYIVLNEELQESVTKIQDINIELQKATEKAKESDRLKSAFLANMSHEIRTPLNAILGFSSLIAFDNITKEEQSQYATLIENGGNHLLRIIDDVIDISKIESNQLLIHKEKFLLTTLFSEVEKTFEIESKSRLKDNLDFRCNWPKNIDEFILYTDLIRLRQVFINLLTNAFKFTSEGYIEYGVRRSTNQTITFYVSDSGIGIDFENQKLIFDRFIQGKSKKLHEGTGLGLSITQGIITLLGGEIWVESEEGKGSTFYFTLPRVQL